MLVFGEKLAKIGQEPDLAVILAISEGERMRRLCKRKKLTANDENSLKLGVQIMNAYREWADRLGWRVFYVDNTNCSATATAGIVRQKLAEVKTLVLKL
jgi:thymidylate kinase